MDVTLKIAIVGAIAVIVGALIKLLGDLIGKGSSRGLVSIVIIVILVLLGGGVFVLQTPVSPIKNETPPAAEVPSSTITPLSPSSILLSEDFHDASSLQGYDTSLWSCNGCGNGSATLEDGALRLEIDGITGVSLRSQSLWQPSQIGYVQAKLMISEYKGADSGSVDLSLNTNLGSIWWQTFCYIEGKQNSAKLSYSCSVVKVDINKQEKYEYFSDPIFVNYNEWQTAKIGLDPSTMELRFYLNEKQIGQYTPADANELKNSGLKVQIAAGSNNTSRHIVAKIDDVILVKAP